jgi:hypothetical protein
MLLQFLEIILNYLRVYILHYKFLSSHPDVGILFLVILAMMMTPEPILY